MGEGGGWRLAAPIITAPVHRVHHQDHMHRHRGGCDCSECDGGDDCVRDGEEGLWCCCLCDDDEVSLAGCVIDVITIVVVIRRQSGASSVRRDS